MSAGELVLVFNTDIDKFIAQVGEARKKLDELEKQAKAAKKSTDASMEGSKGSAGAAGESKMQAAMKAGKKGAEDLKKSINDTDGALKKMGGSLLAQAKTAGMLFAGYLTFQGMKKLVVDTGAANEALGDQAEAMRMNVSDLDAWRKSAETLGVSADGVANSLKNISRQSKTPQADMLNLADQFGNMSAAAAEIRGQSMGFDEGTIKLLRKGRAGVQGLLEQQKKLGLTTQEQVDKSKKYNQQLRGLGVQFGAMTADLGMALMPAMEKFIGWLSKFSSWVSDNKEAIFDVFAVLGAVVTAKLLPAMIRLAIANTVAFAPIIAGIAIVTGLILVVSDLIGYFNGAESAVGDLVKEFPVLAEVLDFVKMAFLGIWSAAKWAFGFLSDFVSAGLIMQFENLKTILTTIIAVFLGLYAAGKLIVGFFTGNADLMSEAWGDFGDLINGVISRALAGFEKIAAAWKKVKGWFGAGKDEVEAASAAGDSSLAMPSDLKNNIEAGQIALNQASQSPMNTSTSNSIANSKVSNNSTQNSSINLGGVTINTQADDAEGIADSLGDALKKANEMSGGGLLA